MAQGLTARIVGLAGNDPLFARIRQEAEEAVRREPELATFLMTNILNHGALESSVAHRVSSRLGHQDLPAALIRQTFTEAIARDPSIGEAFRADIMAVADRDPACLRMMEPLLYFKGFQALQAYRLSHWLLKVGRRDFALSLQSLVSATFGVDINPGARIGKGVFLDHATGLVVGETTVIEDNVSILQGVTLGGTGKETGDRHPKIRHGVLIGAGGEDSRQYRDRLLRARGVRLRRACAGAAQQDGRRRPGPHRRRSRMRRAGARHEPDPGRQGGRAPELRLVGRLAGRPRFWQSDPAWNRARVSAVDKAEIVKLREFLRKSFGAPALQVTPNSKSAEAADVSLGERKIGEIAVDDEDGDRSFSFAMKVPVGRPILQDYLRKLFENDKLTVLGRLKKTDSVELNNGPDFLGIVSADDPQGSSFTLQMAILDIDLDDE